MDKKYQLGELVECLWRDKCYYNATISAVHNNGTYNVNFVDDCYRRLKVPEAEIRPYEAPEDPSIDPPTALVTSDKARQRVGVEVAFGAPRSSEPKRKSSPRIDAGSYLAQFPQQMLSRHDFDNIYCKCCNKVITGILSTIRTHVKSQLHVDNLAKV